MNIPSFGFLLRRWLLCVLMVMGMCFGAVAQQRLDWGDQGNGTYKNPVLNADYSDPDVVRVGERYYMVASDFHFMGMQVLESDDMVNWHIVGQIYDRFDLPGWDGNNHYGGGSWAPSIRHHDGRFYVYFCTPTEGLFMSSAVDARGPWSPLHQVKAVGNWEDPCPLWDDDGNAYLGRSQLGAGPIIVHRMSADGRQLLDDGVTVYTGPVAEGTKWLKRDGYYYLIIPEGGVEGGWQTVLRSRSVYGPYEKRVVLEQGSTAVNGPHQGSLVDTPQGEWWFYHFQHTPVIGRVVHLQPARWKDGWPLMGVDIDGNGVGEPVEVWPCPMKGAGTPSLPATSDDFSSPKMGMQWQWNHNPVDDKWSLTERPGWLTLHAMAADNLKMARGTLTQKVMGFASIATTLVDCTALGSETSAGLLCMGSDYRAIGVGPEGIYTENNGQRTTVVSAKKPRKVWLRLTMKSSDNVHRFEYSTDGRNYVAAGEPFEMHCGNWKGVRTGIYCYGSQGKAQFDFFKYDIIR